MAKFNVGDKVRSIAPVGHEGVTGAYGEIVAIGEDDYQPFLVKFYRYIGGHDGYGECNKRGWWCKTSDIKLVKENVHMFTKKDLKNGDVVLRRNGNVDVVILELNCLLNNYHGGFKLSNIKDDLKHTHNSDYDIIAVRRFDDPETISFDAFDDENGELVYERKEVEEMTLAEVCKALGKEIKIVKEK